ncbi:MAG: auxin-binding protein [Gammaproteobacteria bacterium]|nr:auxin-binding protein [Gammaproteobacteria bacterium]
MKKLVSLLLMALAVPVAAQDVSLPNINDAIEPQQSAGGEYRLMVEPGLSPMRLNTLHYWKLRLTDAKGRAVDGASINVDGGMPGHGHGLPTVPRVIAGDEPGLYLLRGLRFNMGGAWELKLKIDDGERNDQVHLQFMVTDTTGS